LIPKDIGIIDMLLGLPGPGHGYWEDRIKRQLRFPDERYGEHLAPYLYSEGIPPELEKPEYISVILEEMDRNGVERGVVALAIDDEVERKLVSRHRDRLVPTLNIDPNDGMTAVRQIDEGVRELGIKGVCMIPAAYAPQVPINDKRMYPIYAKCIEHDIAALVSVGVPGPRIPFAAQQVDLVDEVCWFYPELRIVLRHGGDPWIDLTVKLLHKWPNLYYATSGWAPKHYPKGIVDFANTRGADKVMYAGYFPFGLTYERIFRELPDVPFRDHVWPKFLRENAIASLRLDS
jgi:predicted TIM-barrel fold metal-dependent hydrolase